MASDRYNYVLTESAEADIDEAFYYIANEPVNPDAASAFADKPEEKLEEICKTPKAARRIIIFRLAALPNCTRAPDG